MSILKTRYGEEPKPWQKRYSSLSLHTKYTNKSGTTAYKLNVALRFFRIACGLKGRGITT
jgi:hypothetical protein